MSDSKQFLRADCVEAARSILAMANKGYCAEPEFAALVAEAQVYATLATVSDDVEDEMRSRWRAEVASR